MEAYYSNQASQSMPHFSGHYRQRGSGFGALAAGIGRVALLLAPLVNRSMSHQTNRNEIKTQKLEILPKLKNGQK